MILFLSMIQAAIGACQPEVQGSWDADVYRAEVMVEAQSGHPPCRSIDMGAVVDWAPSKAKISLRQWDDSRQVFGVERVFARAGRWVVHIPEMRSEETVTIDLEAERVEVSPLWKEEQVDPQPYAKIMDIEWRARGKPLFGTDGTVSRKVRLEIQEEALPGVHRQWWPLGAVDGRCEAWLDGAKLAVDANEYGCGVRLEGGDILTWKLSWQEPTASSSDEWNLGSSDVVRLRGAEFVSTGIDPVSNTEGLQFQGPGRLSVRVNKMADVPIENNAVEEVFYAAKAVSLPEPGVGIEFKGYRGDESVIPVVLEKLRSQVVTGELPGQHPLKPRKLTTVRKSRWGTPWEQALILSRYLQQLKISAEAFPVRPALLGPVLAGAPLGYSGAVVRVNTEAGVVWLDPSCAVCGVGEINPTLWGGALFGAESSQLPQDPSGDISVQHEGRTMQITLVGTPALELRRWLTQHPVAKRSEAIAKRFGGDGAVLVSHEGLVELGAPITLHVQTQSRR